MSTMALNLARKWRSKKFDQVIGQDLSVKILKNSLYKNHLFPVYLFSGQHGCGKTTTARVFAAALNCQQLSNFQKDPKNIILPCLTCASCSAMFHQNHPDFIEIDGASHTGVDNVRNIIDAATLLPVMGTYKVYLIDEAHMLSKSAFNALLKLLEEPPASVVFILATTDPQKILKTVKSRCFQLFFDPVTAHVIQDHLQKVCKQEAITHELSALSLIAQESGGSVRDALNILEQVRFATGLLTPSAVKMVLGHVDEKEIIQLMEGVILGKVSRLLTLCKQMKLSIKSIEFLWRKTALLIRELLWRKHGVSSDAFSSFEKQLDALSATVSTQTLHSMLEKLYANELLFNKTGAQYELFEMILLQMASACSNTNDSSGTPPSAITLKQPVEDDNAHEVEEESQEEDEEQEDIEELKSQTVWHVFVKLIEQEQEPLLTSICSQVVNAQYDVNAKILSLTFSYEHTFFTPLLEQCSEVWKPLLAQAAGDSFATLDISFLKPCVASGSVPPVIEPKRDTLDFSNKQEWPKTNLVLDYFPGTIKEIQRG
jgi:DNA polymerase III subunit gamma/tau